MRISGISVVERWPSVGVAALAVAVLAWVAACTPDSGELGPDNPAIPQSRVLASNQGLSTEPVFVSLPPGSAPSGTSATIVNVQTGISITVAMMDGGFDPVPVDAIAGDSLEVEIAVGGGAPPIRYVIRVPAHVPPIVVRTEPTTGKRDVPLNARIIIVFSEPIDQGTLNAGAIKLRHGGEEINGIVRFVDDWHLTAEFVPFGTLAPESVYELVVSSEIRDLDGDPLQAAVSIGFTTASAATHQLVFTVQPTNTALDSAIAPAVTVAVYDAQGRIVTGFNDSITIAFVQNPGGMPLAGTTKVAAFQGVASFPTLRVSYSAWGYRFRATAAGATAAFSATFTVARTVPPPVALSLSPAALEVAQGGSANSLVTGPGGTAFSSNVILELAGAPTGVTATFMRLSFYRVLVINVGPAVLPGAHDLVMRWTDAGGTDSVILPLTVTPDTAGFGLSVSSSVMTIYIGDSRNVGVTISRTTESGLVSLRASSQPSGMPATFDHDIAPPGNTATLRLSTVGNSGLHRLGIIGTGASGSNAAEIFVYTPRYIPAPPAP